MHFSVIKKMKKINPVSFKADTELLNLIEDTIKKLNSEVNLEIDRSDFIRIALTRLCLELKTGSLSSSEFLYKRLQNISK